MTDWPLSNICEPHETNDVLLRKKIKTIPPIAFDQGQQQQEYRYEGNQRFLELLRAREEDYNGKNSMEKPLVALELLNQWRAQAPPGRFLVPLELPAATTNNNQQAPPPLWKDVGDKEARSRISKALKHLSSSSSVSSFGEDGQGETKSAAEVPPLTWAQVAATPVSPTRQQNNIHEHPNMERQESDKPIPRSIAQHAITNINSTNSVTIIPQQEQSNNHPTLTHFLRNKSPDEMPPNTIIPRMVHPEKLGGRRISAQLHAVKAQGKLYGRREERQRLVEIFKGQMGASSTASSLSLSRRLSSSSSRIGQQQRQVKNSKTSTSSTNDNNTIQLDKKVDLVLIQGPLGVGKTALARTLKQPMVLTGDGSDEGEAKEDLETRPSFFLEAKFEQLMNPNPYKAFVDVFNDFCSQLLQYNNNDNDNNHSNKLVEEFRQTILDAMEDDVDVLLNLIPALRPILYPGLGDDAPTSSSSDDDDGEPASNKTFSALSGVMLAQKVKGYFVLLLQTIASLVPRYPVVILLNDLHWASEIAMDILTVLVSDVVTPEQNGGIIFVATTSFCDPCKITVKPYITQAKEKLAARQSVEVHEIQLENLKETDVRDFAVDTLDCEYENVLAISQFLFSITKGNPLFLAEFLRKLQEHGFIYTNEESGDFEFNVETMNTEFRDIQSISDLIRKKIRSFPMDVQKTLMYACSLGSSQIDTSLLELVSPENTSTHLEHVMQFGVLRKRDTYYYFAVDGMQLEIYSLIPDDEKAAIHLKIAQQLWQHLDDRKKDKEFLFFLLNQLMLGDDDLTQDDDRRAVAALCLQGGETAVKTLGFQTAWVYLEHGISILPKDKMWGRDNYDLALRLHNAAIEVCYCNAQYDIVDELVETIIQHSRVFDDSLLARTTNIFSKGSRHHLSEAIDSALNTLNELGEHFHPCPSLVCVFFDFRKTKRMLRGLSDESILRMKPMRDSKKLAAMQILNHMYLYAFYSRPYMALLVSLRMVQITLEFGVCEVSSVAFCFYAELLIGGPSIEQGLRFGKLGMKLYEKFKNEAWLCRVWRSYYGAVLITKEPTAISFEPLKHAYRVGLRTGDIDYAMMSGLFYVICAVELIPLPKVMAEIRNLTTEMKQTGRTLALVLLKPIADFISALLAGPDEWIQFVERDESQKDQTISNGGAELWTQYTKMATAYIYNDYELALKHSGSVKFIYIKYGFSSIASANVLFFECLVLLANARKSRFNRLRYVPYVRRRLKLLKGWAFMAPENLLSRQYLLSAELAAVVGDPKKASSDFRSCILHARDQGRIALEALGNERFGRFLVEKGDVDAAVPFLDEACRLYDDWGAKSKAAQLRSYRESALLEWTCPTTLNLGCES